MVAQGEYMRGEWQREEPREAGGSTSFTNFQAVLEIQLVTSGKTLRAVKQGSNMTTFAPIKWTGVRVEMGATLGTAIIIKLEMGCGCMKEQWADSRDVSESKSIGFSIKLDVKA